MEIIFIVIFTITEELIWSFSLSGINNQSWKVSLCGINQYEFPFIKWNYWNKCSCRQIMTFMEMVLYWIRSSKNQPLSSNIILKTTTLFLYSFYFILMQLFLIMLFLYFLSVALILPDTFRILFRSLMFSGVTVCTFLFVPFCCCMLCVFPVIHRHPGSMRHHLPVTLIEQ